MKKQLSKGLSFFICLILVLISSFVFNRIFDYGRTLFYEHKIEKNLNDKAQDSKYDFLYYDDDIKEETKDIYRGYVKSIDFITDELKEKETKIYIANKKVLNSVSELTGSKRFNIADNSIALYIDKLNLIVVDNSYDPTKGSFILSESEIPEKILRVLKENNIKPKGDSYYLDLETILPKILSEEELDSIRYIYNRKTLYHELGHFMDYNSPIKLSKDKNFKKVFEEEKNVIFSELDNYYKDDIREYIAECVSFILNDGSIEESISVDTKLNTNEYIKSLIDYFK